MNTTVDLSCFFLGTKLDSCIFNASGPWCSTQEELEKLSLSDSSIVLTKSCTVHKRDGNPEPRYSDIPNGSINSMGLPNMGIDFYLNFYNENKIKKPYIISIAGLNHEENIEMVSRVNKFVNPVFAVELNLSCPNIIGKAQIAYDPQATEKLLSGIFKLNPKIPIGLKLPPYFDMAHFDQMAKIFSNFPISFITAINSIGNALYIDYKTESVVIKPKNGFGGLGGMCVKPTALANVRKWHELLPNVPIIGCGGIMSGQDIFEHILCGATAVQIGTFYMQNGISCFSKLKSELINIMQQKSYPSVKSLQGKLKTI